ncbi:TWiK family of potassium channels protein 12 [Aphelenchoides bicaudatus]|nr:TWiK family of potassium channels protein 12 [Aphelenchoides bicaudatus]
MWHKIYQKFKQTYKRFKLRWYLPFLILIIYTVLGATIFRYFELEPDIQRRIAYRNHTEYAFNQILKRMLEIRCMDQSMRINNNLQTRYTKDALFWFLDHLNLTEVIEERSDMQSPWSWMGAMFFAGQLYTTIGYGLPVAVTSGGRIASLLYIMVGIPVFLIILKDVGQLLSRGLRRLYKRIHSAKNRLPDGRRMSAPVKAIYSLSMSPLAMLGADLYNTVENNKVADQSDPEKVALDSPTDSPKNPPGILKKPAENGEIDPKKQNEINEKIKKSNNFPISLAITILVIWILLSSALFCLWETEWSFFTSVYFFFVSISTVGLGDIIPAKRDMMIVNFVLILIGLALLSMCINLIQATLERFINGLLEDYIREFEKMAEIVNTGDEFTEESLKPFEVDMTDMLTVPLTTIAQDEHRGGIWEIGRNAKDWVAEQVANNLLINRLYPHYESSSESEGSGEEDVSDEEESKKHSEDNELKEVVVTDKDDHSLADVASISNMLTVRRSSKGSTSTRETKDNVSRVSVKGHKKEKKHKHHHPLRQMNPFFNYNPGTLRAIQMIETAKLRTDKNPNFKSRLFAKFATNTKLTSLVNDKPQAKMVSFSVQTSPIVEREQRKPARMSYGVGLGSVDSFSSINQTNNDTSTMKSFDVDSLCSSAYYDVNFNGYNKEQSVPQMIAQATPPSNHKNSNQRISLGSKNNTPPQSSAPTIKLDHTSQSPPNPLAAETAGRHQRRRYSAANCLPIPTNSSDKVYDLPLLNSRMPLARCPSCSTVSTDTAPEPQTIQRVHELCGIMPSDFLHHTHRPTGSRPMSMMSDYENSAAMEHSFHRHAPSPTSKPPAKSSQIPVKHQLHRSKRLEDSGIAAPELSAEEKQPHDKSPMLDSGLGEFLKTQQVDANPKEEGPSDS